MAKGRIKNHGIFTENEWNYVQAWEGDDMAAARKIGLKSALKLMRKPHVLEAIRQKQLGMARASGEKLGEAVRVCPEAIINRLWELAEMKPTDTNLNISGQVKAAGELAEIFGMKVKLSADMTEKLAEGKTKEELIYAGIHGRWAESPEVAAAFVRGLPAPHPGTGSSGRTQ